MKIRMVEERTGGRWDGRTWPPVGGEIDVDPEEGAAVCAAGWAVPVAETRKAETPEDSLKAAEETRTATATATVAGKAAASGKSKT